MIIYLLNGSLPWTEYQFHPNEKYLGTLTLKKQITIEEIC